MTFSTDEFYGSEQQQTMLRRGRAMFDMLRDDTRLTYYGRTVGITDAVAADLDLLERLAFLQGASHFAAVPVADANALAAQISERGLSVTLYPRWVGGDAALKRAKDIVASFPLPRDLSVRTIGPNAPVKDLDLLADIAEISGVLLPAGSVLRGILKPGVAIVAVEAEGRPVSCSGAAGICHPENPTFGRQAWWGMLSTHPDRRGERIALILGAMAMIAMHERFGFASFMTGVQAGNAPSEALCSKLGYTPDGMTTVTVVDPRAISSGKLTS